MTAPLVHANRIILLGLFALMAATRSHHFASVTHLPDASWAVFLLAGFYSGRAWLFVALLALAGLTDYLAIGWFGVSDYCISAAYGFLAPAYGALWLAGSWYGRHHHLQASTLLPLSAALLAGTALCEAISGGSFYFLAGRAAETSLAGYAAQFLNYYPASLQGTALYVG
ncbi:MAG: hypothetical protein FIA97_20610, partial [Methylococcaceae bacterium]|nr:hypothetical protein [Methylococcaceae bacterium]